MNEKQKKYNGQVEITDLMTEAVENAVRRRNQALQEDALLGLSDSEAAGIAGGQIKNIAVAGYKPICPPIIVGLIIANDQQLA